MSIFSTNVVTPSFNSPLLMGCPSSNCALTDHTENVICNHPQFEYQCIGRELSGWKPLQIHVSFYLTMKLPTFPMGMIQIDALSMESFPESRRINSGLSVSLWQRVIVSCRNSTVPFWQCCFPSRSSKLMAYPSLPIYAIICA